MGLIFFQRDVRYFFQFSETDPYPRLVKTPIKIYCFSLSIRDWNDLPDFLISSSELSDDLVCPS